MYVNVWLTQIYPLRHASRKVCLPSFPAAKQIYIGGEQYTVVPVRSNSQLHGTAVQGRGLSCELSCEYLGHGVQPLDESLIREAGSQLATESTWAILAVPLLSRQTPDIICHTHNHSSRLFFGSFGINCVRMY